MLAGKLAAEVIVDRAAGLEEPAAVALNGALSTATPSFSAVIDALDGVSGAGVGTSMRTTNTGTSTSSSTSYGDNTNGGAGIESATGGINSSGRQASTIPLISAGAAADKARKAGGQGKAIEKSIRVRAANAVPKDPVGLHGAYIFSFMCLLSATIITG